MGGTIYYLLFTIYYLFDGGMTGVVQGVVCDVNLYWDGNSGAFLSRAAGGWPIKALCGFCGS